MAEGICTQVAELEAGDCIHLSQTKPETERNFNIAFYTRIFANVVHAIADRPVVVLDADHVVKRPIIEVFKRDWDIAAVYRSQSFDKYGRHDYCSGLILLNNRRPGLIVRFCKEWLDSMSSRPPSPGFCPKVLRKQGWLDTWFDDQTSLNDVIIPEKEEVEHEKIYSIRDYRILPLDWRSYTLPGEEVFIVHYKGSRKKQ